MTRPFLEFFRLHEKRVGDDVRVGSGRYGEFKPAGLDDDRRRFGVGAGNK